MCKQEVDLDPPPEDDAEIMSGDVGNLDEGAVSRSVPSSSSASRPARQGVHVNSLQELD